MNIFNARNPCKEMADWLAIIKHNPLHQLFRMRLGHVALDEVWNEAGAIACCGDYGDEGHACHCAAAKVNFIIGHWSKEYSFSIIRMPSATELRGLYNKKLLIQMFISETVATVELNAKQGEKYVNVDVPHGLTRADIENILIEEFPECKIKWKWFIQSYRIRWAT